MQVWCRWYGYVISKLRKFLHKLKIAAFMKIIPKDTTPNSAWLEGLFVLYLFIYLLFVRVCGRACHGTQQKEDNLGEPLPSLPSGSQGSNSV